MAAQTGGGFLDISDKDGIRGERIELRDFDLATGTDAAVPIRSDMDRLITRCGGAPRVLVVEDDHLIGTDMAQFLRDTGFEVVGIANSPNAALDFLAMKDMRIDCAVIDIQLGDRTSQPVAQELDRQAMPYVVVTGHDEATVRELGIGAPTIEKPFDGVRLGVKLTRLLLLAGASDCTICA